MAYRFTGFTNDLGFRVFKFELCGIEYDHGRVHKEYTFRADLALVLKYGVPLQELPRLCQGMLESGIVEDGRYDFTYTEADMIAYTQANAAAVELENTKRSHQQRSDAPPKQKPEQKPTNPSRWGRWSHKAAYREDSKSPSPADGI